MDRRRGAVRPRPHRRARCGRSSASASSRTSSRSASRWATATPSRRSSRAARSSSQLVGRTTLFSTFGGNPVSAAAALAVLDVIEDERVLERVQRTGRRSAPRCSTIDHPEIADVRGVGLAWGVEFADRRASPRGPRRDAPARRAGRHHRPHGNVLKIRPPLALNETHVPQLAGTLQQALSSKLIIACFTRVSEQLCGAHRATSVACSTSAVNSLTASSESSSSGPRTGPVVKPVTRRRPSPRRCSSCSRARRTAARCAPTARARRAGRCRRSAGGAARRTAPG